MWIVVRGAVWRVLMMMMRLVRIECHRWIYHHIRFVGHVWCQMMLLLKWVYLNDVRCTIGQLHRWRL